MSVGALTPTFLFEIERRLRNIEEFEFARMLTSRVLWWNKVTKVSDIAGKSERVTWFLSSANIRQVTPADGSFINAGDITFEQLVTQTAEYFPALHTDGFQIAKREVMALDGTGLDALQTIMSGWGALSAYYPQRLVAQVLLNGGATDNSANAYDGVPYFIGNTPSAQFPTVSGHPVNPFFPGYGGYATLLTGAPGAAGYPGACPIDDSITFDLAVMNLAKAVAYIAGIGMPNGQDPRMLQASYILHPPRMKVRVQQLTNAKYYGAATAGGGGGAQDMADAVGKIFDNAAGWPIEAMELAAARTYTFKAANGSTKQVTGSDTTYYIVTTENMTSQLGGFILTLFEAFKTTFYSGESGPSLGLDAILDRQNLLEYHHQGVMAANYGHPYGVIKGTQT
jgi:hypothetical protein